MRRASVSVANIAEGNGGETSGSYVQFLRVAQGSLKGNWRRTCCWFNALASQTRRQIEPILAECDKQGRMLRALIGVIQDKARAEE